MDGKLTFLQERAALEGLYENRSISIHDRLQIGRQLIASYKEEAEFLRAWYMLHISLECAHTNAHDGCDETVVCKNRCWCQCHYEEERE